MPQHRPNLAGWLVTADSLGGDYSSLNVGKRVIAMYKGGHPPANLPNWMNDRRIPAVAWKDLAKALA